MTQEQRQELHDEIEKIREIGVDLFKGHPSQTATHEEMYEMFAQVYKVLSIMEREIWP